MKWDEYFFEIASVVAKNSKCLSRQVGAILVDDKNVICTGYNGPPRECPPCNERYKNDEFLIKELNKRGIKIHEHTSQFCPRQTLGYKSGDGLNFCHASHGERNVIITAARLGISTHGKKLYCNCNIPCGDCLIEIINSGIEEVIITKLEFYDEKSEYLVKHSNLLIRQYDFMKGE
jgi:dCMP deaminase